jgi:hypothetical protein
LYERIVYCCIIEKRHIELGVICRILFVVENSKGKRQCEGEEE